MRDRTAEELLALFPNLTPGTYANKSKATARYNCLAFANSDDRHWWEHGTFGGGIHWPPSAPKNGSLDAWLQIFTSDGYEITDDREIEAGFQKIAIYVDMESLEPSHVAISDGIVWKSKLGKLQDIHHYSLDVLEGEEPSYGIVERILKRPAPQV